MIEWDCQEGEWKQLFTRIETTETSWSAMRIWPIIREAVLLPWNRRQHFWPLLALPVALTTLLSLGEYWLLSDVPRTVSRLLGMLIFSFFAVACHRSILIGEHSVSRFGIPGWPHREFRFFLWLIFIYTIATMFMFLASEVAVRLTDFIDSFHGEGSPKVSVKLLGGRLDFFPLVLLGLIPFGYIIGRLSLLLPAIAVDVQASLRSAWSQSKGNGWRMALLVGWIPTLFLLLESTLSFYINWLLGNQPTPYSLGVYVGIFSASEALLRYTLFTIQVAILSLSFLKLSGWYTNLVPQITTLDRLR
jgi:hypothetical protein